VWVGARATISPSAELVALVLIGENTAVGDGAVVGPFAVVGADCLVDEDAAVREAVVLPHGYVGHGVEVEGVLADGHRVLNPRRGRADSVDGLFLGSLAPRHPLEPLGSALVRIAAAGVFVFGLPLLLAAALWLKLFRAGPLLTRRELVRTPASLDESRWRTFRVRTLAPARPEEIRTGWIIPATPRGLLLELLPALLNVALGDLRLVGLPSRSAESLQALPESRQGGYLRTPAGLVSETALLFPGLPADDELVLADAFQAHAGSVRENAGRLGRFLLRGLGLVAGPRPAGRGEKALARRR
jgi:NDP-sugar pyrophosphorylase family protein